MKLTRKRLARVTGERNTPRMIDLRQEYCNILYHLDYDKLVFLDETGVDLRHSRNYWYSPKNSKTIKIVKGNRGKNIGTLVAIKKTEYLDLKRYNGLLMVNFSLNLLK